MAKFPHCDSNVLHAPGVCVYCDGYPRQQNARKVAGINFTGEKDENKIPCPAEFKRPFEIINKWGGNIPVQTGGMAYIEYIDEIGYIPTPEEKGSRWTKLLRSTRQHFVSVLQKSKGN